MKRGYAIRLARKADLPELIRLEQAVFTSDRFSRRQIHYLLTRAHGTTLVVERKGELAGAAYLLWRASTTSGRLYSIAIDPGRQGEGLGALLLAQAESEAIRRGCRRLSLEVRIDNTGAIAFYERHGYRVVDRLDGYYADGTPGYRMVKLLAPQVP